MSSSEPGAPSLTSRAISGVLWLGLLNSGASVFVLFLWAHLNRAMPNAPVQMGLWMFALKLLLLTNLVFEGGLTSVLKQRAALSPGAVTAIGRLQALLGGLGGLALYLGAPVLAPLFPALPTEELEHLLRLCAPVVVVVSLGFTQKALIERELSFRKVALIESSSTLLFVGLGAWLGRTRGAEGLVVATLVRHGLETSLYWLLGPLTRAILFGRAQWRGLSQHLRFGGSIFGQSVLGNLLRHADVLIAGVLLSEAGVAVYAQLQLFIALPLSKISLYAARVAFPTFAHVQDQPERLLNGLRKLQALTALAVFPALAGLVAVGPRLVRLYLGPEYADWFFLAWPALLILSIGAGCYTYAYGVAIVVNACGAAEALLKRQLAGAALLVAVVSLCGLAGFLPMAAGRSLALAAASFLFLQLGRTVTRFGWDEIGRTLYPSLPASIAMGLLVAAAGEAATRWIPLSNPWVFDDTSTVVILATLAAQVLLGTVSYVLLLRLMGLDAFAEARSLLRRRGVAASKPSS